MTGLYDYFIYNYINAMKEKLLLATFPKKETSNTTNGGSIES